jgi:hypothetical protein
MACWSSFFVIWNRMEYSIEWGRSHWSVRVILNIQSRTLALALALAP